MARNPELEAASRVKRTLSNLTFRSKVRAIALVLKSIGLPFFSAQLLEALEGGGDG